MPRYVSVELPKGYLWEDQEGIENVFEGVTENVVREKICAISTCWASLSIVRETSSALIGCCNIVLCLYKR